MVGRFHKPVQCLAFPAIAQFRDFRGDQLRACERAKRLFGCLIASLRDDRQLLSTGKAGFEAVTATSIPSALAGQTKSRDLPLRGGS